MFNLEEIETNIHTSIKSVLSNHPIFSIKALTIFGTFTILALSVMMMLALIGIAHIEESAKESFQNGNIDQYNSQMFVINFSTIFYCYIDILIKISILLLVGIIIYILYKYIILPERKTIASVK